MNEAIAQIILAAVRREWAIYREDLKARYPAPPGEQWRFLCDIHQRIDDLLSEKTARPLMCGWRVFRCDACGAQWEAASRDYASPSGEDCACGEWVMPHAFRPDDTLPIDKFGNLIKTYARKTVGNERV